MSVLIVSPKGKGNTYDLSRYIVNNTDAELLVLERKEERDWKGYNSIFLSSGVYGGKVHKDLLEWLKGIEKTSISEDARFHMFLTWFGRGKSYKNAIEEVNIYLNENGFNLDDDCMTCYGGKGFIRRGHPDGEDCEKVLNWLKSKI